MKRSKIFALIGIGAAIIVIIGVLVFNTRPYLKVSQVLANPPAYYNREIQVIGYVEGYSGNMFNVTEGANKLLVDASAVSLPPGFQDNIEVVITGILNTSLILKALVVLADCS